MLAVKMYVLTYSKRKFLSLIRNDKHGKKSFDIFNSLLVCYVFTCFDSTYAKILFEVQYLCGVTGLQKM